LGGRSLKDPGATRQQTHLALGVRARSPACLSRPSSGLNPRARAACESHAGKRGCYYTEGWC